MLSFPFPVEINANKLWALCTRVLSQKSEKRPGLLLLVEGAEKAEYPLWACYAMQQGTVTFLRTSLLVRCSICLSPEQNVRHKWHLRLKKNKKTPKKNICEIEKMARKCDLKWKIVDLSKQKRWKMIGDTKEYLVACLIERSSSKVQSSTTPRRGGGLSKNICWQLF